MPSRTTKTTTTTNIIIPSTAIKTTNQDLVTELNSIKHSASRRPSTETSYIMNSSLSATSPSLSTSSLTSSSVVTKVKISSLRRSNSLPLLKIDDVQRQRLDAINTQLNCDKKYSNTDLTTITKTMTTTTTICANQDANIFKLSSSEKQVNFSEQNPSTGNNHNEDNVDADGTSRCTREDLRFGCAHYKRRAMFVTPCCNKFYKCRFCHDENETHHFDRKTLNELICSECNTRQKVQESCSQCGVRFGKYICLICNLFDDTDRKQYHCNACGICRIGGAENFFHCEVCNMCLPMQLKIDGHKCVENISRSHCPVCLGDIHTSRIPCHIPDCGHLLHNMCFDQLLASGHYACPTCQTSLIDMTALWEFLDSQALKMPMPTKYEKEKIHIFCNDCQKTSKTFFHFIGLKCMECGAYNTTQDVKRRVSLVPDEPNTA